LSARRALTALALSSLCSFPERASAEEPNPPAGAAAAPAPEPRTPEPLRAPEPPKQPPSPDVRPPLGLFPIDEDALIDPRMLRSWATAPPRLFVSTAFDFGFVYARPRVSLGYGRPFTSWVGVDANPIASSAGLGAYGGLRFEIPYFDLRIGTRYFWAFRHTYLDTKPSYDRLDLETSDGTRAQTVTYEAEADAALPAGPGRILLRASLSYVDAVPEGQSVFEETLHIIVDPPLVWRARVGYVFAFGERGQHGIGLVADFLDVPKRDDSKTFRAGPVLRMALSRRVEVRGSFVAPLVSPDRIGLIGGDFTELGVRYRWASE
jgi:hypothetical protein